MAEIRTIDDLLHAARSLARHFNSDKIVIIGSQAVLLEHPDAPPLMRTSGEIDAYLGNRHEWESENNGTLASEEINALFGWGSAFHNEFDFYIDGVDDTTAILPPDWETRANKRDINVDGVAVLLVAPGMEDLIVSKLFRLDQKDKDFIAAWHQHYPLDENLIIERLNECSPEKAILDRAIQFLRSLGQVEPLPKTRAGAAKPPRLE